MVPLEFDELPEVLVDAEEDGSLGAGNRDLMVSQVRCIASQLVCGS